MGEKAQLKEKRWSVRSQLTGAAPGLMKVEEREEPLNYRPVDVSESGLGIVCAYQLQVGSKVVLLSAQEDCHFEVAWHKKIADIGPEAFQIGMRLISKNVNLIRAFIEAGGFDDGG